MEALEKAWLSTRNGLQQAKYNNEHGTAIEIEVDRTTCCCDEQLLTINIMGWIMGSLDT